MSGFQGRLNNDLPVGFEGDFASTNPHHSLLNAIEAQYKAGANGVTVGRFAWVDPATGLATNVKGSLTLLGFVGREGTAVISNGTGAESSLLVRGGYGVTLYDGGDFWGRFAAGATIGQNVFAKDADGTLVSDAGTTLANHTLTPFKVASTAAAGELAKITGWIK